ncbi:MAG: DUF433 domain-containing protein [Acidobacteria bacterium]|nr:DUF433 domain-containing protein [Acidobacteriota bacterium]MBI3421699.1 DUF433 domain-containing protein [Acidobacteriota bacterium]
MSKPAVATKRKVQPKIVVLDVPPPKQGRRKHPELPPITTHPERLGGTPTIAGTRLPVTTLLDYLMEGATIQEFVDDFGAVSLADAEAVLQQLKNALATGWLAEQVEQ